MEIIGYSLAFIIILFGCVVLKWLGVWKRLFEMDFSTSRSDETTEERKGREKKRSRRIKRIAVLVVVLIAFAVLLPKSIIIVQSGSRGVLMEFGEVTNMLDNGVHFVTPFKDAVVLMNTQTQLAKAVDQSCGTFDMQEVFVDIAVNYQLNPLAVDDIYTELRQDYLKRVVIPNIEESIKASTSGYTAEELLQKRESVKTTFKDILTDRLRSYNIDVIDVAITNYRFNQQFLDSTNRKVIALQDAEKAKNDLERIKWEAQQQIIQAEAAANATIATATAEAMARVIAAESQAEAIQYIQEQLAQNPEYLQYLTIMAWNGELPYFMGGDVMPFLQLPTNMTDP